jgi:hypothetical protein
MDALKYQSEQERTLGTEFQKVTEPFTTVRGAYNQILTAKDTNPAHAAAADTAMVYGYMQLVNPNAGVRPGATMNIEQMRSFPEQVQKMYDQVTKPGGEGLTEEQRKTILEHAPKLYRAAEQVYEQQLSTFRQQAAAYPNVRPHIVAPDIRANPASGQAATPSGQKVVSQAMLQQLSQRYGIPEAELRQRLQAAGKQVQ